jgi:hypothetical protein
MVDGEGLSLPRPPAAFDQAALAALAGADPARHDDATVERQLRHEPAQPRAAARDDEWVGREPSGERRVERAVAQESWDRPSRRERRAAPGTAIRKNRTLSKPTEDRPRRAQDPIQLTDRVRGLPPVEPEGSKRRSRTMMLVAGVLLLLSGGIVALVGLTGTGLEDRPPRADLGGWLATQRDLRAPLVAPPDPDAATLDAGSRTQPDQGSPSPDLARPDASAPPLLEGKAVLKVESTPAKAGVILEGTEQCLTPCTIEELEPKVYLLSLKRAGYVNWSRLIDAAAERRPRVEAQLQEEPDASRVGWLHVISTPPAEIYVDGKFIGRVSSEGRIALPPGRYDISLRHPRKTRRPEFQVTIVRLQTVSIRERL